jgi:transposase
MPDISFEVKIHKAAGIDIHKDKIVCGIMGTGIATQVKEYGTFTKDLRLLVEDLQSLGIVHTVMESTGIYWLPLYGLLEAANISAIIANPLRIKQIPGKKTDTNDSLWLCKLLMNGLAEGSFIPAEDVRQLRDLHRQRYHYIGELSRVKSRVLKVLESCNIKLRSLLSNVNTISARDIIAALAQGETDIEVLKKLLRKRAKKHLPLLGDALEGTLTEPSRYLLTMHLKDWDYLNEQVKSLESRSKQIIDTRHSESAALLKKIPGIGPQSATIILSEIGNNVDAFSSADKLASWAGLAPGNKQSAGVWHNQHTTKGNKYLRLAMIQAAWAAVRTKNGYWQAQFNWLCKRLPKKKAIIAIARKLIKLIYRTLKDSLTYQEKGATWYYEEKQRIRTLLQQKKSNVMPNSVAG